MYTTERRNDVCLNKATVEKMKNCVLFHEKMKAGVFSLNIKIDPGCFNALPVSAEENQLKACSRNDFIPGLAIPD